MIGKDGRFYEPYYDLNNDGKLDGFEIASMEKNFLGHEEEEKKINDFDEELYDELDINDIDPEDLEDMDEDEIRELLEDAGLDPDDFDDF